MSGLLGRLDLPVGKPLPHDLVDNLGRLLVAKGCSIESAEKVEDLLGRGVTFTDNIVVNTPSPGGAPLRQSGPSKRFVEANPFERVSEVINDLERISLHEGPTKTFESQIKNMASILANSCDADPDAVLASLVLSQRASYAVKHEVDVAILAAVVGQKMSIPQADRI